MVCASIFVFVKQKTAYEMRISDWSSDLCSSALCGLSKRRFGGDDVGFCRFERLGGRRGLDRRRRYFLRFPPCQEPPEERDDDDQHDERDDPVFLKPSHDDLPLGQLMRG